MAGGLRCNAAASQALLFVLDATACIARDSDFSSGGDVKTSRSTYRRYRDDAVSIERRRDSVILCAGLRLQETLTRVVAAKL